MHQVKKRVSPTVAVLLYLVHSTRSIQQAVEEPGLVQATQRPIAVELGFAHPMGKVVAEQVSGNSRRQAVEALGFACPTQRLVVELAFVPNPVFVVAALDFERSTLGPVVVELGFAHPILLVVAEHPIHWVVDQAGSKNLHLVHFPVGSILVGEPVVPDVANLKQQQH